MEPKTRFALFGYCLLAGSTWLLSDLVAGTWPELLQLCFHDALLCIGLVAFAFVRGEFRRPQLGLGAIAAWGAVVLGVPTASLALSDRHVRGLDGTLIFALVPFFTVFLVAQARSEGLESLLPAALAVGGLGLIVPFSLPGTAAAWAWLILLFTGSLVVAVGGIRLHRLLPEGSPLVTGAAIAGATALLAGCCWLPTEHAAIDLSWRVLATESAWGLVIDGPLLLLVLFVVRSMEPTGASTRFVLAPVVTLVGSLVVLRVSVAWTTWLGLALAAGGGWLLIRRDSGDGPIPLAPDSP